MFVRWQEYKSRAKSRRLRAFRKKHGPHRLRAILVETVRIDGKPHQRYLAYLGSVQADRRDRPRFWYDVTRKLDQCRLSREERNRIKSAIAKKIGGKVPTRWIPMNVMAPTMQVACKAFIVPNPAARSPKERYTPVPRSLRRVRHARCFNGECPSEATDKIGIRHI